MGAYQVPDQNLKVETEINEPDICFYDVRQAPFDVYGLYNHRTEPEFKRMPDDIAAKTSPRVAQLARNTAGGRVRFCTDSLYVAIKARMPAVGHMPHIPLLGSAGFDLYLDLPEGSISRYWGSFIPPMNTPAMEGYESVIRFADRRRRWITVNLPTYSDVKDLYIGLQKDAKLGGGLPYRSELPVVYYGSSITQGGCASRPGNTYQSIVTRRLGLDHINLGFSGNGKGEACMIEYLASLPMLAFVSDYDHNAPTAEHLKATHCKLYEAVRAAHPDIPYIMMSMTDLNSLKQSSRTLDGRRIVFETFEYARANGDRNVYFVDGREIFRGAVEDQCTVDGCHPNDLGFALMADSVEAVLREALIKQLY